MNRFLHMASVCILVCAAFCLLIFPAEGAITTTPATVTLSNLVQTYNGADRIPSVVTNPADLPVQVVYRNLSPSAPAPVSQVVYDDSPGTLDPSYYSFGFQSSKYSALGNYVQLGGSARKLQSCDVILVTWAKAADWTALAAANPAGYIHPITISIYEVNSANQLSTLPLAEATQNVLVPWRPVNHPTNGYAFRASVPFTNGIVLPERVLIMVSFNTETYGFQPIGVAGPYNYLNVGHKNALNPATVGNDVDPNVVLQVKNGAYLYPSTGWTSTSVPMARLYASSLETTTPPVNAGSWQATARVSNPNYLGSASSVFTIQPAAATVQLSNLNQIFDGNPKYATVTTNPPNIAVTTTYSGPSSPPNAPGTYAVQSVIADPNYQGAAANGELSVLMGQTFSSWLNPWVTNGQIPPTATGDEDDPDQDSLTNLLEYALGLDPSTENHGLPNLGSPQAEISNGQLSLIYRKNLAATDLQFQVESATQLDGPEQWSPAVTTDTVIATVGPVQTIRASLAAAPGQPLRFLRLRVTR